MPVLIETANSIAGLTGNVNAAYGSHVRPVLSVGLTGLNIGEVPLDPGMHELGQIDNASMMSFALGTDYPYVREEIPLEPLHVNVVVHDETAQTVEHEWLKPVLEARSHMGLDIIDSLEYGRFPADQVSMFVVGQPEAPDIYGDDADVRWSQDPARTAKLMADICRRGLSIVISNFEVPFAGEMRAIAGKQTLAVKVNHERELSLLPKNGVWSMGSIKDVNTNKPKDLKRANEALTAKHGAIRTSLKRAGVMVTQVSLNGNGFGSKEDRLIAKAIDKL